MDIVNPVLVSDQVDVTTESLSILSASQDSWLLRAMSRIRDEASCPDPDAAVAAFNSSL